jgi:ribonuclease HI/transposase InsO family protein
MEAIMRMEAPRSQKKV